MLTIGRVVKGMVLYRVIGMLGNMDLSVMSRLVVSIPVLGKTFLDIKIQTKGCFMQFKIQIRMTRKIPGTSSALNHNCAQKIPAMSLA